MNQKLYNAVLVFLLVVLAASLGGNVYQYNLNKEQLAESDQAEIDLINRANLAILSQREQKDEIADIFDSQAALNDDLIDAQSSAITSAEDFLFLMDASIRFVAGEPQFAPSFNQSRYNQSKNTMVGDIAELESISQENASIKEANSERVKEIYIQAREDRNNTANEREGFR